MNNKFLLFCISLITLVSCETEQPLSFTSENFSEVNLPNCKETSCPEITINYFSVSGEERTSEAINSEIKNFIISSLKVMEEESNANSIEEASKNFIQTYRRDRAEFPDMAGEYVAEINVRKNLKTPEILSIEEQQYKFTGGAHGYGSTTFANFDPKTGELLQQKDLFNNVDDFKDFAETAFRKQHDISEGKSINATGFWFENETFYLPKNIGFTKENVIIIYNQYDIASYAEGPIELKIPMKEAEEFLSFSLD